MIDRSWMLNPTAIACAKRCIQAVEKELDIKLKLSHPQFLEMIGEYAELTSAQELQGAYAELARMAGISINTAKVVPISSATPTVAQACHNRPDTAHENQVIDYRGKQYPRFNDTGKEFKGLYRGQARYA